MASTRSKGKPIVEELDSNKLRKTAKRKFMSPVKESIESSHTEDAEEDQETSITSPKTESKKQKMGDLAEMVIEMRKTREMNQNESKEIKKMIEKQSNEIKESINNIKVDIVRVEAETKKDIVNLRAEMEEKLEEKIAKMQHESALQNIRKKEIIMFKINESQAEDDVVRKAEDKTEVLKTLNEVYKIDERDMIFCNRVGKKQSNPTNP
jgi:hypothetical protein